MKAYLQEKDLTKIEKISREFILIAFLIFSAGILATGIYVYNKYYDDVRNKVIDELTSVSNLKIDEISHWRKERMRNLSVIQNEVFCSRIKRTLENLDNPAVQKEMLDWFFKFQDSYGYDRICLHDMEGNEKMHTTQSEIEMPYPIKTYYEKLFNKKEVVFEEFYYDRKQNKIYLPLLVGMFDFRNKMNPLGTIICRLDPVDYLYPLLEKWPVPRQTAQMHLVKKDDDEVLFLNQLTRENRFRTGFNLNDKVNTDLPAAKAVSGITGYYESVDFKKEKVMTYIQSVPETEWKLIVKINEKEAMKPVSGILLGVSSVVVLLIMLLGTGMVFIIRYQRYSYYREIAKKASELQISEDRVRKLNRTLEQKVVERTLELELSNKELESFSYSVSHDLRAPLRHILGFADIIKREIPNSSSGVSESLDKIIKSTNEMGNLIDDLLDYSRTGRTELKITDVDMNDIVNNIIINIEIENPKRNIVWKRNKLPPSKCDQALIRTVWQNLIDNAVKYTSDKDPAEIEAGFIESQAEYKYFVKDNGVGFDMNYSHKLFGVFQRLHSKNNFEGNGIGLANVRRIINRHKGRTWAEGEVGSGAVFYFSLPKNPEIEA